MKKKRKIAAAMLAALVFAGSFNLAQTEIAEAVDDPSQHYDVWHDFEDQIWAPTPAGEQISGTYNTSMMLTHETETNGNKYMKAAGNHTSAWRATMYSLSDEEVSGAEVTFDFMPIRTNGSTRYGEMMFFSSADHFSYFNIAFNEALQIYYYSTPGVNYTADLYAAIDMDGNPLPNGTYDTRNAALIDTGLQGDGSTWFEAKVVFDYVNSRADLTITNKADPTKSFTQNGIPIREAAVNVNRFLLTAFKGQPEYGIDNFGVKYLTEIDPSRYYTTYWNDFETGVWEPKAIGTGIIAEGGTSGATLTQTAENPDNRFMQVDAPNSGSYRVSRLDLPSDPLSGADVTFDWKPISAQDSASLFGDVAFISSGSTHPYFGLQFNKNREISYYTIGENVAPGWGLTYSEEALEGGFKRDSAFDSGTAVRTGITADGNSWYRVNLSFDYDAHQADLTIASRDNPDNVLYQMENIPIYASAVNPAIVAAGGWKGIISMGLDNFGVRYQYSDADSISSLQQPASVMVTAAEWAEHVGARPAQATATMGDGSVREFEIGPWTSTPAFDENTFTTYTWTAPLVLPDGIGNPKNLALAYETEYVSGYAATGAYDPTALELDYGSVSNVEELLGLLPTQTDAVLSNGKVVKMDIDADTWTATYTTLQDQYLGSYVPPQFDSPEFNPEQEGVYVYKAKLKSTGEYEVNGEIWVEARVNYFAYDDNLNGYERAIENLDRGLYVIPNAVYDSATKTYIESEQGGNYLSWRILVHEYAKVGDGKNITFEIYRDGSKVATLENKTNYLDLGGEAGDKYQIKATQDGAATHSQEVEAMENNYLSLNLQRPLPSYSATGNFAMYRLNDLSVADVDGDGEYEIAVKWYPGNGFDPGVSGTNRMSSPHIIDVYKMDGTALWRLNMGYSSPAGQHFDNFMFYDLDQDGEAEFSILTQDGTRTYRPDENGLFRYVTTDESGYVFQPTNSAESESGGEYVLSDDGHGYVLSNAEGYDFAYVGDYGSPVMDDDYLVDVVGDIELEGANMRTDGFKDIAVNEYFTVFNGKTGEIIDSVDYVFDSANVVGTDGFNLGNRYNIGIARIPADLDNPDSGETIPAVLANRAYYARATVAAYTLVDGEIQLAWTTDTINEIKGGGNHNMVTGDMDNDGFDELYLGGTAIDHDGSILWAKDGAYNKDFMKHGDMIAMTAVFPDSDQLYVFTPVEDKSVSTVLNYALTNAATGARIVGHTFGQADTGRGMVANVTPSAGYELWASTPSGMVNGRISGALFNAYGEVVARDGEALTRPAVQTWSGYWDGDLLAELPDSNPSGGGDKSGLPMGVHKYNWNTGETETIASFAGTLTNNSTKNNPGLMADIMGDWREEILVRSADNEELRIYMTGIPTDYAIYTLMHDSVYRNAVANQNTTYNQVAHTSFYLGEDEVGRNRVLNFELPTYPTRYTAELDDHEPVNPDTPTPPQPPVGGGTAQPDPKPELGKDGVIRLEGGPSEGSDTSLNAEIDGELAVDALEASPDGKLRIRSGGTGLTLEGKWLGELLKLDGRLGVQLGTEKPADLPEALRLAAERAGAEQVYLIAVEADGQTIDEIQRGSATVSLPYDSSEVAAPHRLVVYELLEDGSLRPVALSRYDVENSTLLFQPDRLSSRYLVMESQATFEDAGGWSLDAIEALAGRGIVNGKEEDIFDPRGMVTRAEFAAMLTRMFGLQADGGAAPFTDVPEDAWYGGDVAAAYALGIVKGRADGTFGGDEFITREEMNVLLHRAATLLGLLQSSDDGDGGSFADESNIAGYAIDAVRELVEAGLVTGHPDGTFAPKETASREQSAAMLWRLLQQINK